MLTLLMLALSNSAAISDPASLVVQDAARVVPVIVEDSARCEDPLIQARREAGQTVRSPLDRSLDDGQARRYLLLDRRDQNNCPLPISYAIPDQPHALGREFGPSVSTSTSPPPPRPGF
jgi:hypothetical protein